LFKRNRNLNYSSNILDGDSKERLSELCQFCNGEKWRLLYRATRDGFGAKDFHQKCDHFENTLIVIKSTSGYIFGGFTSMAWNLPVNYYPGMHYVSDPSSYIFSLVNKNNKPFKTIFSSEQGIFCNKDSGPSFGYREPIFSNRGNIKEYIIHYGLRIFTDSNINQPSYSNIGYGFISPDYREGSGKARTFLTGSYNFQTVEIEVFTNSN